MSRVVYDIDRQSLADRVYHYIKNMILAAELKGGEKIPEETIAGRFGISRTPVREALRRLEEYGLVKIVPRTHAEVVALSPEEAESVSRVRAAIEVLAVEILAVEGNEEDFDAIAAIAAECDAAIFRGDVAGAFEKDGAFHLEIAKRTRNEHLFVIMEKLDSKVQLLRLVLHLPHERLRFFIGQHQHIIRCLRERDAEQASHVMKEHILGQLRDFEPKPPHS